jgi:uncharacterized membrane protein YhaH (DUF805 family)
MCGCSSRHVSEIMRRHLGRTVTAGEIVARIISMYSLFGRAGRREFLITHAYIVAIAIVVFIFMSGLLPGSLGEEARIIWLTVAGRPLRYFYFFKGANEEQFALLCIIGLIWLFYAATMGSVAVRRLHDRGRSGFWMLIMFFGYFAKNPPDQILVQLPLSHNTVPFVIEGLRILYLLASMWYIIELGAFPSEHGTNKHGPEPLSSESVN